MKIVDKKKEKFVTKRGLTSSSSSSLIINADDKQIELQFDSDQEISDMIEKLRDLLDKNNIFINAAYTNESIMEYRIRQMGKNFYERKCNDNE